MTRRADNELLDAAIEHARYCEEAAQSLKCGAAFIALACALLLAWYVLQVLP